MVILVMNFWGPCERYIDNLVQARAAFGDSLLLVPVSGDVNVLLFAFKQTPPQSITDELESFARRLQMRLLLDFPGIFGAFAQGIPLADPQTSTELQVAAAFCLPARSCDRREPASGPVDGLRGREVVTIAAGAT